MNSIHSYRSRRDELLITGVAMLLIAGIVAMILFL